MDAETTLITSTEALKISSLAPRSFFLMVSFHGELPPSLRNERIPLKVSVSLPVEYAPYTKPILRTVPTDDLEDTLDGLSSTSDRFDELAQAMSDYGEPLTVTDAMEVQEIPISFLPLVRSFNHQDGQSWSNLLNAISNWLVDEVKILKRQEWAWGTDTFWMAFVAAYPSFPRGTWPVWDHRIALDGTFIHEWLDHGGREGWSRRYNVAFDDNSDGLTQFRDQIWVLFQSHISLFHNSPLF